MAIDDETARYWGRAAQWTLKEAWGLICYEVDPREMGDDFGIPMGVLIEAHQIFPEELDRLRTELVRFGGAEAKVAANTECTPEQWIELFRKAEIPVPDNLQAFVATTKGKLVSAVPTDNKLLGVIAALRAAWPSGKLPSAKELEKAAASVGVLITDDTIRKALNAAWEIAKGRPPTN